MSQRVRRRHDSCGTILTNEGDSRKSPEYMNLAQVYQVLNRSPSIQKSHHPYQVDQQIIASQRSIEKPSSLSADLESQRDFLIKNEDYYKAPATIYNDGLSFFATPFIHQQQQQQQQQPINHHVTVEDWTAVGLPRPIDQQIARNVGHTGMSPILYQTSANQGASGKMPPPPPPKPSKTLSTPSNLGINIKNRYKVDTNGKQVSVNDCNRSSVDISDQDKSVTNKEPIKSGFPPEESNGQVIELGPPPNFVKQRIKSLEAIRQQEITNDNSKTNSGIMSDSDITCNSAKREEDIIVEENMTTNSAPITYTSSSSVLADLRKTAEIRKEKVYGDVPSPTSITRDAVGNDIYQNESEKKACFASRDEISMRLAEERVESQAEFNGYAENVLAAKENNNIANNETKIHVNYSVKHDSKDFELSRSKKSNNNKNDDDDVNANADELDDKGEEADDEMSRDFNGELTMNTLLPQSAKQLLYMQRAAERKQANCNGATEPEDDVDNENGDNKHSQITVTSPSECPIENISSKRSKIPSSYASMVDAYSTSMDNPAYVSASFLGNSREAYRLPHESHSYTHNGNTTELDNKVPKLAPYYYSDLLTDQSSEPDHDSVLSQRKHEQKDKSMTNLRKPPEMLPVQVDNNKSEINASSSSNSDAASVEIATPVSKSISFILPSINNSLSASSNSRWSSQVTANECLDKNFFANNSDSNSHSKAHKRISRSLEHIDDDHLYENIENFKDVTTIEPPELFRKSSSQKNLTQQDKEEVINSYKHITDTEHADTESASFLIEREGINRAITRYIH